MAGKGPSILVIAADQSERSLIASTLREAGFAALSAEPGRAAMALRRGRFAAAVVALPEADAAAAIAAARDVQAGLPAVQVVDPAASRAIEEGCAVLVNRPLDLRRLLGAVVELVLREDGRAAPVPRHGYAAELGIAAAGLACLRNRRVAAAAAGAARLAQDLSRQIGEMRTTCRGLAAVADRHAVEGCAG
jgi:DNA-binding NtrC family response regulator